MYSTTPSIPENLDINHTDSTHVFRMRQDVVGRLLLFILVWLRERARNASFWNRDLFGCLGLSGKVGRRASYARSWVGRDIRETFPDQGLLRQEGSSIANLLFLGMTTSLQVCRNPDLPGPSAHQLTDIASSKCMSGRHAHRGRWHWILRVRPNRKNGEVYGVHDA